MPEFQTIFQCDAIFKLYKGWCYTGNGEFGYCSEINELPDTPDSVHPLLEVQTFILPKEVSKVVCIKP